MSRGAPDMPAAAGCLAIVSAKITDSGPRQTLRPSMLVSLSKQKPFDGHDTYISQDCLGTCFLARPCQRAPRPLQFISDPVPACPRPLRSPLGFDPQLVAAQQVLQAAQQQAAQQAAQQLQQLHPTLASGPAIPQAQPAISAAALPHTGPLQTHAGQQQQQPDVDMGGTEAVVPPIVIHNPKEPVSVSAARWCSSLGMPQLLCHSINVLVVNVGDGGAERQQLERQSMP